MTKQMPHMTTATHEQTIANEEPPLERSLNIRLNTKLISQAYKKAYPCTG